MRSLKEIAAEIAQLEGTKAALEAQIKTINSELRDAVANEFKSAFEVADKLSGDMTLLIDDIKLKGKIPKKVTWDSKMLQGIASSMAWDKAQKIFDIKFSVPEKSYSAVAISGDDDLLAKLDAARTVEFGDLKIEIVGE